MHITSTSGTFYCAHLGKVSYIRFDVNFVRDFIDIDIDTWRVSTLGTRWHSVDKVRRVINTSTVLFPVPPTLRCRRLVDRRYSMNSKWETDLATRYAPVLRYIYWTHDWGVGATIPPQSPLPLPSDETAIGRFNDLVMMMRLRRRSRTSHWEAS